MSLWWWVCPWCSHKTPDRYTETEAANDRDDHPCRRAANPDPAVLTLHSYHFHEALR